MNNTIQKCIDELKKDTFSKEYVLGMLETFLEMSGKRDIPIQGPSTTINLPKELFNPNVQPIQETTEEDELAARYAGGPIGTINTY